MSNIIELKKQIVEEISGKLQNSQSAVLVDYRGLDVAAATKLRAELRESGVDFTVYKNTMVRRAAAEAGLEGLNDYLTGPNAIAFGLEDAVAPAKVLNNFAKENDALEIKAGVVDGQVIDAAGVKALADLPSREQLIAQVLGGLNGPISGFVNVLQGTKRSLVYALNAIKEEKEKEA